MSEVTDDFDWADAPSVVIHEQRAVAVYWNERCGGAVVVREEAGPLEEADHYIRIAPENALKVAKAILRAAGVRASVILDSETGWSAQAVLALEEEAGDDMGIPFGKPSPEPNPSPASHLELPLLRVINSEKENRSVSA